MLWVCAGGVCGGIRSNDSWRCELRSLEFFYPKILLLEGMFNGVEAGTVVANPLPGMYYQEDNGV